MEQSHLKLRACLDNWLFGLPGNNCGEMGGLINRAPVLNTVIPLLLITCIFSPPLRACENLLVGRWQSDGDVTMSFNKAHARLEETQDDFLASLMGNMTLEFTEEELHLFMPDTQVRVQGELRPIVGFEQRKPYKILFCSTGMVVIEVAEAVTEERSVTTYFFVGEDVMWVYSGTNNPVIPDLHIREYFKRVQ